MQGMRIDAVINKQGKAAPKVAWRLSMGGGCVRLQQLSFSSLSSFVYVCVLFFIFWNFILFSVILFRSTFFCACNTIRLENFY